MSKGIVINRCFGGFGLSEEAYEYLGLKWDGYGHACEVERDDPKLVECVETLGSERASGGFARLKVVYIPDGVQWEISNYDGMETVREKSRSWN